MKTKWWLGSYLLLKSLGLRSRHRPSWKLLFLLQVKRRNCGWRTSLCPQMFATSIWAALITRILSKSPARSSLSRPAGSTKWWTRWIRQFSKRLFSRSVRTSFLQMLDIEKNFSFDLKTFVKVSKHLVDKASRVLWFANKTRKNKYWKLEENELCSLNTVCFLFKFWITLSVFLPSRPTWSPWITTGLTRVLLQTLGSFCVENWIKWRTLSAMWRTRLAGKSRPRCVLHVMSFSYGIYREPPDYSCRSCWTRSQASTFSFSSSSSSLFCSGASRRSPGRRT